ncbi:MAG: autotransporter domain-containing protein, partial [Burkholderiales bacterium]
MRNGKHKQQGVAYLGLMFVVLFMGMMVGTYIESWSTTAQRERETALLWTGNEYRKAIRNYYELSPGGNKQYPKSLDDLLEDKRFVTVQRHLRQRYRDPLGSKDDYAKGSRDADQLFASLTTSYEYRQGPLSLTPYGRLNASTTRMDAF